MASPTTWTSRGSIAGTGSAINVDTVGYRPRKVSLINADGDAFLNWHHPMPDASGMKTIAAGTTAFISSNGVTPRANGFTIGADADINAAGELIYWEAYA